MSSSQNRSGYRASARHLASFAACSVGLCVALGLGSLAATQEPGGYQAYALQHALAEQVEGVISPLVPPGTEIVADRKGNRILIRGSSESQQIAQRVIASLDRVRPGDAAPAASLPVLKVYPCPPGGAAALAGSLEEEFGRTPGVRIVADDRTSQVLVLAAPETQARVSARLGPASGETGKTPPVEPAQSPSPAQTFLPFPPSANSIAQKIQLRRTAASLESSLASMFGDRLVQSSQTPGTAAYRLRLSDGNEVGFTVDRGTNCIAFSAGGTAGGAFGQLIQALDQADSSADQSTRLVPLRTTRPTDARRTVDAIRASNVSQERSPAGRSAAAKSLPLVTQILQPPARKAETNAVAAPGEPGAALVALQPEPPPPGPGMGPKPPGPGLRSRADETAGLIGPVQIEMLPGLDVLVIRGNKRDVQQVVEIIQQIEKLSVETEPAIEVYPLVHADCSAVSTLVTQLYAQVFETRQGSATIVPLVKPNALLLVGRKENVERVISLVKKLDVAVSPDSRFQVFRLKHAAAATAQTMIEDSFADPTGLAPVVRVVTDQRTNSLIVHGSPRDLAEVAAMIARIDTDEIPAVNELRVFELTNTVAADLATTLMDAIQSQDVTQVQAGVGGAGVPGVARPAGAAGRVGTTPGGTAGQRSSALQFVTVDRRGQTRLSSGILTGVRISYDIRANTVIVNAPAKSMPLIEALIKQLDRPPAVRAEVKVFTVANGDASALVTMLSDFFGVTTTGTTGTGMTGTMGGPNLQTAAREGESSLVPLRFAADPRTNSIIASGTAGDLLVVEAMLMRLDATDVKSRVSAVYRLKNAPANDVATAINNFLRSELTAINIQTGGATLLSPFEQIEHQVVVVAEPVSNSLIVAATPRYFDEIKKIVEDLDRRPPMVIIQVLIAEVDLTNNDEFGVELGLQDKVLFGRGIPTSGSTLSPGFLFNTDTLGNQNSTSALTNPGTVGGQGLTNFGVGRTTTSGFGGLVLSASSESVSVLIRALKARQRVDVLARPQIQTLDNQTAYINVGQSVAQIMGVTSTTYGQTNNIQYTNTGIIMGVTPRISPDGIVVMEIDATRSDLGPEAEGTPIFVSATGQIIRAPRVNQTLAQTTVSATDGQTVVLGGLISKQINESHRTVPYLSDVPVLGNLFRFDSKVATRTELLIIMTPHVVRTEEDAEAVKRIEAARMHWCLADVIEVSGESGLRGRKDDWPDSETKVIYPDGDPRMQRGPSDSPVPAPMPPSASPEVVPKPESTPFRLEPSGTPGAGAAPSPGGTSRSGTGGTRPAPGPQSPTAQGGRWPAANPPPPVWPPTSRTVEPAAFQDPIPGAASAPQQVPAVYQEQSPY